MLCVDRWKLVMEWRLSWSFHGISFHACVQCAFMCGVVFVGCICMLVWILFMAKKGRPWGLLLLGLIGMLIMSLWLGYQCACVCMCVWVFLKDPWLISRGNVWPREPCPPHRPALTLPWREDGVSLSWREIGSQESGPQNYHMGSSPNKTLQHVCGNEEPCFCVWVICQWPPPTSLLTWLRLPPLLMFGWFLLFLSTPCRTLEGSTEKRRNPTASLPWGPLLVMAEWPYRGGCTIMRAGKISYVKTQTDGSVK